MQSFEIQLKKILKERKISQLELANMSGLSRQTVNMIIAGGDMKMSTMIALSEALNVPMSYWFAGEEPRQVSKTLEQKYIEALEEIRDLHRELKQLHK